jgi:hypothetical protein
MTRVDAAVLLGVWSKELVVTSSVRCLESLDPVLQPWGAPFPCIDPQTPLTCALRRSPSPGNRSAGEAAVGGGGPGG